MISIIKLVKDNYSALFDASGVSLIKGNIPIATGIVDGLFKLNVSTSDSTVSLVCTNKRNRINYSSGNLWHRRLGHISQKRVERLVKDGLLGSLDFSDLETCIDCLKSKTTNTFRKIAMKSEANLDLIHTDVCGPFSIPYFTGQRYFVTFIDDYSRFMYLYLIHEKSEVPQAFKDFKTEVEKQLGKPIKSVRSDRGGEYYGRHTEMG